MTRQVTLSAKELADLLKELMRYREHGEALAQIVRTLRIDGDLGPAGLRALEAWEEAVREGD